MTELNEDLYGDGPQVMPDYEKMFGDAEDTEENNTDSDDNESDEEIIEEVPEDNPEDPNYFGDDVIWEGEDDG